MIKFEILKCLRERHVTAGEWIWLVERVFSPLIPTTFSATEQNQSPTVGRQSPGLAVFHWLYQTTSRLLPVTTRGVPFSGDIKLCLSLRDLPRKKKPLFS